MATAETRRRFETLGMLLVPVVLVQLTATFLGGGPRSSNADAYDDDAAPDGEAALVLAEVTSAQLEALDYGQSLAGAEYGPCPMLFDALPSIADDPEPIMVPDDVVTIVVQAIMRTDDGNIALIDGALHRAGHVLESDDQWRVGEIDAVKSVVRLENMVTGEDRVIGVRDAKREVETP